MKKTPQVYFVAGVVVGVIITLAVTTLVSLLISLSTPKDDIMPAPVKNLPFQESSLLYTADSASTKPVSTALSDEEYVVKEGDTLESVIIRFYGTFDMTKVNAIAEANKMANPNALSIGQKLIIPMN